MARDNIRKKQAFRRQELPNGSLNTSSEAAIEETALDQSTTAHQNTDDFSLEIPEEVKETDVPPIMLGVALSGPFQFPAGLRPVSPVFLVCVCEHRNFQFSKPVTVTIPHFLDLENDEDIQSLGLTFLKANHNKNSDGLYEFQPTSGEMDFRSLAKHGILQTTHFCSLCIACEDKPEALEKTKFCITSVLPNSSIPTGKKTYAYFFVTLRNLKTCLRRLKEIIDGMNLVGYEVKTEPFEFKKNSERDPALEIVVTQPTTGVIGVTGTKTVPASFKKTFTIILKCPQVLRKDVDFFVREKLTKDDLLAQESAEFYPPRFTVFFASPHSNTTLSGGKIEFTGATKHLSYDIYLHVSTDEAVSAPGTIISILCINC